jgi:hypothetical protein
MEATRLQLAPHAPRSVGHASRVRQNAALTSFAAWFGHTGPILVRVARELTIDHVPPHDQVELRNSFTRGRSHDRHLGIINYKPIQADRELDFETSELSLAA